MNTTVTATGMSVKAVAEDGLLINYVTTVGDAGWSDTANTASSAISLTPSSTQDLSAWYHNHSKKSNDGQDYVTTSWSTLSITDARTNPVSTTSGGYDLGTFADDISTNTLNAYVKYIYYIKSSAAAITLGGSEVYKELDVDKITVSGQTADGLDLCKSLRVGVKIGTTYKIFAPFAGATDTYNVGGSSSSYTVDGTGALAVGTTDYTANTDLLTSGTIPAVDTTAPTEVDVYIWFEGEDVNCKSDNTDVLNQLSVTVSFNLETTAD